MPDQWDSILGLWVEELGTNFFPLDLELSGNEPGKKNLLQRNISRQTNSLMVEKDTFLTPQVLVRAWWRGSWLSPSLLLFSSKS